MSFDIAAVRACFPSMLITDQGMPRVYFDNPAGTQVPQTVVDAISDCLIRTNANLGGFFSTTRLAVEVVDAAHEAMREGCVSCHSPHGSVNDKMLKARGNALCYQCHFQNQTADTAIIHGGGNHAGNVIRGTCWSAGCHEAVHGSHTSKPLRY